MIIKNYEPKTTDIEIQDKKRVVNILNRIKYNLLDYYLNPNTIVELRKNR